MNRNQINKDFIIKYLILSIPILLITGPLLSEIAIGIICILIFPKLLNHELKEKNKFFIYGFFFFYLVIVLGSILSDYKFLSLKSTLFYIRFLILVLSIYYILSSSQNFLKLLKNVLSIVFIILILDGIYQFLFYENIFGFNNENKTRVSSFFGKELIYGSYLSRFLPILIGLLIFFIKDKRDETIVYLLIPFSLFAIFISGERAAFLLSLISIVIILFATNFFSKSKLYISLVLFALISFTTLSNDKIKTKWQTTISNSFLNYSDNQITIENKSYPLIIDKKYTYMALSAIKMFKDRPILGHGVKTFRFNCKKKPYRFDEFNVYNYRLNCGNHPHNTYIQLISETGLMGLSLILFYFLYISYTLLRTLWSRQKRKYKKLFDLKICILTCIFINLFPFTTSGNFFNNWLSIVYFFPIGIFIYLNEAN